MKKSRIVTILLLAVMMFSTVACSSHTAETGETVPTAEMESETAEVEAFPVQNWEGREFRIISRGSDYGAWESHDVFTDELTGEPLNDALYERNNIIFEKHGIEITESKQGKLGEVIQSMVTAGDTLFDAAVTAGADASTLSASNYLMDLHSLPNLDLTNEWWDQNAAQDFSFGNKLFMGVSDFLISDKDGSWIYVFNKTLSDELGLEYPYDMAREGTWTYDQMHRLASAAIADLDGDGKMAIEVDQFGVVTEEYDTYAAFFYSGARIFSIGESGYPEFVFYNERNAEAFNRYIELFVKDKDLYYAQWTSTKEELKAFIEGRGLFKGYTLGGLRIAEFREMEDDFGIIVSPKYDEAQENYAHVVSIGTSASVICVPVTAPDPAFTGYALEASSYESTATLIDTYINKGFNGKYVRDQESSEMLKLCFNSRVFDLSIIYTQWGGLFSKLYGLKPYSSINLASMNAAVESSVQQSLQEMIDMYLENDN